MKERKNERELEEGGQNDGVPSHEDTELKADNQTDGSRLRRSKIQDSKVFIVICTVKQVLILYGI